MTNHHINRQNTFSTFLIGLIVFFCTNLFSAFTMGVHFDETYYWLYAQHPALGYFDHPPMVSWMIMASDLLFKGTLSIRFCTVLLSSLSMVVVWSLVKPYGIKPLLFWSLIYSVILIHPYAFITTPDAPLFFFTALFFLVYKQFIKQASIQNAILLAVVTSLLFYSKYHSILIVGFTFLSNLKILKSKHFWLYFGLLILALLPHLFWQIDNNFISFRYHLLDSHNTVYNPMLTIKYIMLLLVLTGPLSGWLLLKILFQKQCIDQFEKALRWTGIGIFSFFMASTFIGDFEAHWTLVAMIPLIIIASKWLGSDKKWQRLIYISGTVNFVLLLATRIIVITPIADNIKALGTFRGWDKDTKELSEFTNNYPIIFQDCWNKAARFGWYTQNKQVAAINSGLYRSNQFDLWHFEHIYDGQTVYIATSDSMQFAYSEVLKTAKTTWYLKKVEKYQSYNNLYFEIETKKIANDSLLVSILIKNPYPFVIELSQQNDAIFQLYSRQGKWKLLAEYPIDYLKIEANSSEKIDIDIKSDNKQNSNRYLMLKMGDLKPLSNLVVIK